MAQFHTRGLAKQPRRRSPWTSRKRLHFLNSLQGPGSACLVWLASGYQKKRFGWLLAGFWLASGWLSGWTSPCLENRVLTWLKLAGPPPSHKQSKVDGTIPRVLRRRSPWTSPGKISYSPGWCLAGPPHCLGAALWRHCPSHKRSTVDGTIPRVGLRSSPGFDRLGRPEKGCTSLTPCKAQAALPNQASYLAETGWTSPLPGGGLVEALPLPQTKHSRWHNSTRGLAKQPRRRLPWTSRKRLHFLNSLQGPGCLAKAGLCLPGLAGFWLSKKEVWLASGWLLADFLVGHPGGLVKALPLPQTKQSRWHNSTRGLAKQPRRRSPWTSRKRLHFLHSLQGPASLAKSALSCLVWLASGYQKKRLLAGFWLAFWLDIVRTWLKLAGFPRCLGAALWRHCPSHKRSKVDGTIPRVGLRSGRPEKGCTSLTPCKAQAALPNQPSLACFGWLLAIKKRGLVGFWLASGWLSGWTYRTYLAETGAPRCLGAALWRHCPSHKRSKVDGTIPRVGLRSSPGVDHFGRPEKGCTSLTLSCLVWLASGYQKKRFGWLLAGFWLASGWLSCWTCPCLEKSRTYLAETGWTSPLPGPCGGTAPPTNEAK